MKSIEIFPHEKIRPIQADLLIAIEKSIESQIPTIIHAPTGLGKTAAALTPAIFAAQKNEKTVLFLTSRITQHRIVIKTVNEINRKTKLKASATDMIGKQHLCLQDHALKGRDFNDYCQYLKEYNQCEYYDRWKSKVGNRALESVQKEMAINAENLLPIAKLHHVCPYELALGHAEVSNVIVADYSYVFVPHIAQSFFPKIKKTLSDCILIIDEGHNLPSRIRSALSSRLSRYTLDRALAECDRFGFKETKRMVLAAIARLSKRQMKTNELPFELEFADKLTVLAEKVQKKQKKSSLLNIAHFITAWHEEGEGYLRYSDGDSYVIRNLDPSNQAKSVFKSAYASVIMSGTMEPLEMYRTILGMPQTSNLISYKSPFPIKNRLSLIIPSVTTLYTKRSLDQYKNYAKIISEIILEVNGNCAIFFPSYSLMQQIAMYTKGSEFIYEKPKLTKTEKAQIQKDLSQKEKTVFFGVVAGSFGEGIDIEANALKCVVIVGVPLDPPDIETKAQIDYYDKKFGKGWDYGYYLPTFNKVMQCAGRPIRSETDTGISIFLDERYAQQKFLRYFPKGLDPITTLNHIAEIRKFQLEISTR